MTLLLAAALAVAGCRATPAAEPGEPEPVEPEPAEPVEPEPVDPPSCAGQPCAPPRECIQYFGIAGPSGPSFQACEIRCERDAGADSCPEGTRCVTVADGPGDVCR